MQNSFDCKNSSKSHGLEPCAFISCLLLLWSHQTTKRGSSYQGFQSSSFQIIPNYIKLFFPHHSTYYSICVPLFLISHTQCLSKWLKEACLMTGNGEYSRHEDICSDQCPGLGWDHLILDTLHMWSRYRDNMKYGIKITNYKIKSLIFAGKCSII